MGIKIKFLNPVSQNKFLHNLVNAKKRNSNYKHLRHYLINEVKDKASLRINDENGEVAVCDMDFYPDGVVHIECEPCDFDKLQSLLVFDFLESINEKAVIRFMDSLFFFNGGMEFYFISGGKTQNIKKVSSNRNDLLEVDNSRTIAEITQILEEINKVDFI